ncbi:MAG: polymer-forming cytoskeletal protein [Anaerolineales bacterium]|uniref:polymer-forming cytoskeletal protein n=1 Tax=Candidatus Villigracilis proximus TaxID=3140683 RepID=UPI0031354116|nr:polymer-forming cytoskeletal protein [Anaerolineales bacterium]
MKTTYKFLSIFSLIALLALTFATPAQAFDGRTGETVEIKADEVIEDDVYVTATEFTLEGTVKGDLIVFGQTIIINGTVEGDLIAAGQSVIINGTVTDDARIAGAELKISKTASVGGDVVSAGASLETEKGSAIAGELVIGAGQALLDGNVTGDVLAGIGSLELNGEFGGDVNAQVGDPEEGGPPPSTYMPQAEIDFPTVKPGFNIGKDAKIKGNLDYTQTKDIKIPANAVSGKVTRSEPVVDKEFEYREPTPTEIATNWTFDLFRSIATLTIFGLLLGWLAPALMKTLTEKVQNQPAASLGWGLVAYAAFFFAILVILVAMIAGGILFGVLTLGSVSGTIIWIGILSIFAMIIGFILITAFLTKIIVAWLSGKLILSRINPALAEHKVWPLLLGVALIALLVALPYIGWLFGMLIMFIGLGAIWIWGRESWAARKIVA